MVHMDLTWDVWRSCTTTPGEPSVMMVGTTMLQEWHAGESTLQWGFRNINMVSHGHHCLGMSKEGTRGKEHLP